jgi:uncharacterized protein (AIM24 family)
LLRDPEFEKSLLNKAQKQQDLVVMNYDTEGTTKVLYEPKTNYKIDRIEVMVDRIRICWIYNIKLPISTY